MRAYEFGTVTGNGTHPKETYRFRVVLGIDPSDGRPDVLIYRGFKSDSACGWSHRHVGTYRLPLKWATAYRLRKVGGLRVYRVLNALARKVVNA